MPKHQTRKISKKDDYIVAIPSYQRADTLREKSLTTLKKYGIPVGKINIFVANREEEALYKEKIPSHMYNKIIIAQKGLKEARNFISNYYPKGKHILFLDDDLKGFIEYDESKPRHEKPLVSLQKVIQRGFKECEKNGCRLWGIYPSANGFFMKPTVTTDLKLIVGCFFGIINPGLSEMKIAISEKEDYYRTLKMYELDGCVVRLNFVAPKTAFYKEPGGMQTNPRRRQEQEEAVKFLLKLYPDWVKLNPSRKSGFMEMRIRDPDAKKMKREDS
jgi:hypothetical protein